MSERDPYNGNLAAERLAKFDSEKARLETEAYWASLIGDAGETDFSPEANLRLQEASVYDEHLSKLANESRGSLHRTLAAAKTDKPAISLERIAEIDAAVSSNPKLRFMDKFAHEIAELKTLASEEEDVEDGLQRQIADKETRLYQLLARFAKGDDPIAQNEIIDHLLSKTETSARHAEENDVLLGELSRDQLEDIANRQMAEAVNALLGSEVLAYSRAVEEGLNALKRMAVLEGWTDEKLKEGEKLFMDEVAAVYHEHARATSNTESDENGEDDLDDQDEDADDGEADTTEPLSENTVAPSHEIIPAPARTDKPGLRGILDDTLALVNRILQSRSNRATQDTEMAGRQWGTRKHDNDMAVAFAWDTGKRDEVFSIQSGLPHPAPLTKEEMDALDPIPAEEKAKIEEDGAARLLAKPLGTILLESEHNPDLKELVSSIDQEIRQAIKAYIRKDDEGKRHWTKGARENVERLVRAIIGNGFNAGVVTEAVNARFGELQEIIADGVISRRQRARSRLIQRLPLVGRR